MKKLLMKIRLLAIAIFRYCKIDIFIKHLTHLYLNTITKSKKNSIEFFVEKCCFFVIEYRIMFLFNP